MCNHNLKHDKCPFIVNFSWYSKFKHYKIVSSTNLTHNHELSNINICLDGCEFINNEADLSAEEINAMQLMAITNYSIAKVKETMAFEYPKRSYCSQLLHRVMEKKRTTLFGDDRHQMITRWSLGANNLPQYYAFLWLSIPDAQNEVMQNVMVINSLI